MNWIKQRKLTAIEAIKHKGQLCLTLDSLWHVLHKLFNSAQNCQVDLNILNKIECKPSQRWSLFSRNEFLSAISKCKDSSAPGPDKLSWHHLKLIIHNDNCLANIIKIADSCINLGFWPNYFKISTTIVIPKPNKIFIWSTKSISTNSPPQHSRQTYWKSNHGKAPIHGRE